MREKPHEEGSPVDPEAVDLIVRGLMRHLTPGSRIIVDKSGQEIDIEVPEPEEPSEDQAPNNIGI